MYLFIIKKLDSRTICTLQDHTSTQYNHCQQRLPTQPTLTVYRNVNTVGAPGGPAEGGPAGLLDQQNQSQT